MTMVNSIDLLNRLNARKKVGNVGITQAEMESYLNTIDAINALDKYSTHLGNYELRNFVIPTAWKVLLQPAHLSINGDINNPDVAYRPTPDEETGILDPTEFNDITEKICGSQRTSDVSPIEREAVVVFNPTGKIAVHNKVDDYSSEWPQFNVIKDVEYVFNTVHHTVDNSVGFSGTLLDKLRDGK